jgi:hypothetical protein
VRVVAPNILYLRIVCVDALPKRQAGFKFEMPLGVFGVPGPPDHLILQY